MTETTKTPTWDDVRRIADELELKMHLAGMEARDRWKALKPRLAELEKDIAKGGNAAASQLATIGTALKELGKEVAEKLDRIAQTPGST